MEGVEEDEESVEKFMGTNLFWDREKLERCERKVLEEERATTVSASDSVSPCVLVAPDTD